jgi:nucleoid-associated protein YgaU
MDKKSGLSGKMDDSEKSKGPRRPSPRKARPAKPEPKWEPKVIAEHTLTDNETWSHLALRYYGDMSEPYWRYMYEFNKEMVGDNYKRIWGGMKIQVPELPDDMKKDKE